MPKTATPRKPETVSRKLAETRNTSKNRSLSSLLGIGDNEKQLATDIASGLNDVAGRGTIAALLGLPADLGGLLWDGGAWVNNKIKDVEYATGMLKPDLASLVTGQRKGYVPYSQGNPYLGAEDIGNRMEQAGLVSDVRRPKTELLASLISPTQAFTAGYKAPQMARAGVKALDNLSAPRTMGRQQGAIYNIFHGTTPEAAASIEKNGFDLSKSADGSIWFTSNPQIGEVAASGKGGIVQRSLDDEAMKLGSWDEADRYGVDELLQQGYDGLKLDDGEETVYQIFNPQKLGNGQPVGNLGKMVAPQDELAQNMAKARQMLEDGTPVAVKDAWYNTLTPDMRFRMAAESGIALPEERAAAMGFVNDAYHGSYADIEAIDPAKFSDRVDYMKGFFTAHSPEMAGNYGDTVYPLLQRNGVQVADRRLARLEGREAPALDTVFDPVRGINVTNNPANIRSRFAAFDPMRRDSSDLLAGLSPLLFAVPADEQY